MNIAKTNEEAWILSVVRLNKLWPKKELVFSRTIGSLKIEFEWRSSKNLWGRFGGGWNWKLGFQLGGSTLIISLLICSITFNLKQRDKE